MITSLRAFCAHRAFPLTDHVLTIASTFVYEVGG